MSILTIMIIKRKDIKVMSTHTNTKSLMLLKSIKNMLIPKFTIKAMILMTITIMKATILIAVIAQMTSTRGRVPCKKERISTITIKVMGVMLMTIIMIMSTNMIMKHME